MTTQPQPEALRLANQLRDILPAFRTPSHERGVLNGAIQRLEQLHAECEALRQANVAFAARQAWWNDRMVALEAECEELRMERDALRAAARHGGWAGYIDSDALRADAERYRWLRENRHVLLLTGFFGNGCVNREIDEVDAAIDAARAAKEQSNG